MFLVTDKIRQTYDIHTSNSTCELWTRPGPGLPLADMDHVTITNWHFNIIENTWKCEKVDIVSPDDHAPPCATEPVGKIVINTNDTESVPALQGWLITTDMYSRVVAL